MAKIISNVQGVNSEDIPTTVRNALIEDGAPKLLSVTDDGSQLSKWLKKNGYVFDMPNHLPEKSWGWLVIWW